MAVRPVTVVWVYPNNRDERVSCVYANTPRAWCKYIWWYFQFFSRNMIWREALVAPRCPSAHRWLVLITTWLRERQKPWREYEGILGTSSRDETTTMLL